jgi:deoxycytidylate deaminase
MRHGAVLTRGNRVLAVAVNANRNSPLIVSDPKTQSAWHAEVAVLRACAGDTAGTTLWVARIGKGGEVRYSAPCVNCQAAIEAAGVKRVVHT